VKDGIKIERKIGNEYAQFVDLRLPNGELCTIANVYIPPNCNLGRRNLTEAVVRDSCLEIL
jgi:hypothetical protein